LAALRHTSQPCIVPKTKQQRLNISRQTFTACRVVDRGVTFSVCRREIDTSVRRPKVTQENRNCLRRLTEHLIRNTFLVGTEPERSHVFKPDAHGIMHPVSQVLSRCEKYLIPVAPSFLADPGSETFSKDLTRERNNILCD